MKTILNLKQCLILFAAVFSLTSCLKSDDPAFQIFADGYVKQDVTEHQTPGGDGEEPTVTYTNEFEPVIRVQPYNYDPITSCTVSGGGSLITMRAVSEYGGILWISTSATSSSTLPTSSFSVSAANGKNETASTTVSFSSLSKEMKGKLNGEIEYDSQNKQLTFSFNKVENATEYIIIARESKNNSLYQSIIVQNFTESDAGKKLSIAEATFAKNLVAGKSYYFTIVALIGTINSGFSVMQEGGSTITPYAAE